MCHDWVCHGWVRLLGAVAVLGAMGAMADCHNWVPNWGAMTGCATPVKNTKYHKIINLLCYLGSRLAKFVAYGDDVFFRKGYMQAIRAGFRRFRLCDPFRQVDKGCCSGMIGLMEMAQMDANGSCKFPQIRWFKRCDAALFNKRIWSQPRLLATTGQILRIVHAAWRATLLKFWNLANMSKRPQTVC